MNDDLDLPAVLSLTWKMVRSDLPGQAKLSLLLKYDEIMGLGLADVPSSYELPQPVRATVDERQMLRGKSDFQTADGLRAELSGSGYLLGDTPEGTRVRPKTGLEKRRERWRALSSSKEAVSNLGVPSEVDFSFVVTACNYLHDAQRCIESILKSAEGYSAELIIVDNGSTDRTSEWVEELSGGRHRVRGFHCDHVLGEGAAKNIGLKLCLGSNVVALDTSVEILGDILGPLAAWLEDESIGVVGPWGLKTPDVRHFHEDGGAGDVDAMQAYCLAFRRELLPKVGLMRETFRFYRNLDLDFSFQFKEHGYRIVADSSLPDGQARAPPVGQPWRGRAGPAQRQELQALPQEMGRATGPAGFGRRKRTPLT